MPRYRIEHRYPCYPGGGCIPYDGYFVQVLQEGSSPTSGLTSKTSAIGRVQRNY